MIRTLNTALLSLALAAALSATAKEPAKAEPPKMTPEQQAMMEAYAKAGAPGAQHAQLAKGAGDYDITVTSWEGPGAAPVVEKGTATRTMMLDGRVMAEEVHSSMYGQPFTGHGMQGYDNVSGKAWSTWNDSMSTGLMVSQGDCDANGACTFTGSWNDPVTKKMTTAHMSTHWTSPTVEVFEMHGPGPDGKEFKMMEITYTKRAK
jgi:hypothetical protein